MTTLAILLIWAIASPAGFYAGMMLATRDGWSDGASFLLAVAASIITPVAAVCALLLIMGGEDDMLKDVDDDSNGE